MALKNMDHIVRSGEKVDCEKVTGGITVECGGELSADTVSGPNARVTVLSGGFASIRMVINTEEREYPFGSVINRGGDVSIGEVAGVSCRAYGQVWTEGGTTTVSTVHDHGLVWVRGGSATVAELAEGKRGPGVVRNHGGVLNVGKVTGGKICAVNDETTIDELSGRADVVSRPGGSVIIHKLSGSVCIQGDWDGSNVTVLKRDPSAEITGGVSIASR
ncbi:hypothetical protein [Actinomadura coerulea]|uniref:hypothetical protein n=1 Tax=Actinomadura coerulea TaxID=46159 RepID=UPI00341C1911